MYVTTQYYNDVHAQKHVRPVEVEERVLYRQIHRSD